MFEVGDLITIDDKEGCVCFIAKYNGYNYVNIAFGDKNFEYKVFRVIEDVDFFTFELETDLNILTELASLFTAERIDEER